MESQRDSVQPMGATEPVKQPVPFPEQAAAIVRDAILTGKYDPGQRLSEVDLSTRLSISRSPVRESLRKLADEGLVIIHPRRGAFVASFDAVEIRELMEFRQALDVMAAGLAAQRITPEGLTTLQNALEAATSAHKLESAAPPWQQDFHILVLRYSGNQRIYERGVEVHTQLHLVRFRSGARAGSAQEAHDEHQLVLDAIQTGNGQIARTSMQTHLENATVRIKNLVENPGNGRSG